LVEGFQKEVFIEAWQVAIGGEGEQLIVEIHEDAVVPGSMLGEGGFEFGGIMRLELPAVRSRWSRQARSSSRDTYSRTRLRRMRPSTG
jgi:hypothetical protein